MKNLQDLRIFVNTANLGSLSACARSMNLSPAVVSAAVKRLETQLGHLLFIRSTRHLRLSNDGGQFLAYAQEALSLLDEGLASMQNTQSLRGMLSLSVPSDLGRNFILPSIDNFMQTHPDLSIHLNLSDSISDLYSQPFDVAIRYGKSKDSQFIALPLAPKNPAIICASPEYLKEYGTPTKPEDLTRHNCLCLGHNDTLLTRWTFMRDEELVNIDVRGNRYSKDGDAIRLWALAGHGIARKSRLDVIDELNNGTLLEIDLGWKGENYPLNMVCAERRLLSPAIHRLREHLVECLESSLL